MATNHLGYAALVAALWPLLHASAARGSVELSCGGDISLWFANLSVVPSASLPS